MDKFKDIFRKQGGIKLVMSYLRTGLLSYAISQLFLTGKSRKSLELLRLGTQLKVYRKIRKKYCQTLIFFDDTYKRPVILQESARKVWICWMQGMENAPELVQKCYASIKKHITDREIVLLTAENRKEYVELPDYIEEKYAKRIITHTHFSDILRVALLAKYGGTWIDATVFCSGGRIPKYMLESDFFVFQNLKPGADGHILNISSWFMTAQAGNRIVLAVKYLLEDYWNKNDRLIDYFLVHHFFAMVKEFYAEEWKQIPQYPNSMPHILLLNMFEPYDKEKWEELKKVCPFHKLTYKSSKENLEKEGTYYKRIVES